MTSTSRDGILVANIMKKYGFQIIPGSSHKAPVRALKQSLGKMMSGSDMLIGVDGPRGPIYRTKPGALYLAKKSNATVVPIIFGAYPAFLLNSWDRYLLPKPFSHAVIMYGDPLQLSSKMNREIIQRESEQIDSILNRLMQKADQIALCSF